VEGPMGVRRLGRASPTRSRSVDPEIVVRRLLYRIGIAFRLHSETVAVQPSITIRKHHTVILVRRCLLYAHEFCTDWQLPRINSAFWRDRLERNVESDRRKQDLLVGSGWRVLVIWECETRETRLDELRAKLQEFFS
jgi:DNA mismatch endonuclease (patch repair protein)